MRSPMQEREALEDDTSDSVATSGSAEEAFLCFSATEVVRIRVSA